MMFEEEGTSPISFQTEGSISQRDEDDHYIDALEEEEEEEGEDDEDEEVDPMDLLSKTPPMTTRCIRRARSRTSSSKPSHVPHKLPTSSSSPSLATMNSSAVNALKAKHDKKMRRLKSDRNAMRSLKHSPLSFEHPDTQKALSPSELRPPPSPFIDTTKQYRSLPSHQVGPEYQAHQEPKHVKKVSTSDPAVAEERVKFHRTFALLIKLGSRGHEEAKSSQEAEGERSRFQTRWPEVLWLELQACFNMVSIDEQDTLLFDARVAVRDVYNDIMNFKVSYSMQPYDRNYTMRCPLKSPRKMGASVCHNGIGCEDAERSEFFFPTESSESLPGKRSRLESSTSHRSLCLPLTHALDSYISATQEAWRSISELLKQLELAEALYPTTKALEAANPEMGSLEFTERVKVLQLWMNLTKEIDQKLSVSEEALGVEDQEVPWPHIDCCDKNPFLSNHVDFKNSNFRLGDPPKVIVANGPEEIIGNSGPDVSPIRGNLVQSNRETSRRKLQRGRSVTFSCGSDSEDEDDTEYFESSQEVPEFENLKEVEEEAAFPGPTSPISSTPSKPASQEGDSPRVNRIFSECHFSFDYDSLTSIYRPFVDCNLKHSGLSKMTSRLHHMLGETIRKLRLALEKPQDGIDRVSFTRGISECESSSSLATQDPWEPDIRTDDILSIYGAWHPDFIKMALPSYLPVFLFLIRIPVDVMHESLRFRLEHKPTADPSLHSVQQLLYECKEVLRAAARVKSYYQKMVSTLVKESVGTLEHLDSDIDDYENNLEDMLQHYFEYLHSWMQMLQKLPQASISLKNILEVEWNFAKQACPSIRGGEAQAGKRFCIMASSLFESISEFLEDSLDAICGQVQDSQSQDDSNVEKESRRKLRKLVIEIRDRLSKALSFSKMFIRDLEIAAEFQCTGSEDCLLAALHKSGHVRVKTVELPAHWVFVPSSIKDSSEVIHSLLDDLCSHEGRVDSPLAAISNGYILLMKAPENREKWTGEEIEVNLNVEVTIQLSDIQVNSILLVVNHSSLLLEQRRIFKKAVGDVINLVNENTSSHATIAQTLQQLKSNALNICGAVTNGIATAEQDCIPLDGSFSLMKDTLDLFYSVGFEYHKEVERLLSGSEKARHAECTLKLADQWMTYVLDKCERGRGKRPRWANQGLEFLSLTLEPQKVASLEDNEYIKLKNKVSSCISYIIGDPDSRPASPTELGTEIGRTSRSISKTSRSSDCSLSPVPTRTNLSRNNSTDLEKLQFGQFLQPFPSTPDVLRKCPQLHIKSGRRSRRIDARLQKMEEERDRKLQEKKHIGFVREDTAPSPVISINCKKVTFNWQRGFKIGDGQFGTMVYSCINMDTGETLAVKEIRFQRNDQSVIKNIADEIHFLEGISHPNLVRYYGVELHREEMLVFMEYCDEGTLAEAAKNGLPEGFIRQYTREICTAISVLHSHNIIHRDIKGANIFLHSDGHVKLGDFGAAIKLKKHQTILGEVNDVMGTVAFMAPEIINNSAEDGYGRAADIWSLGCVVIEMASGKRPWHEYDNNYAIMYTVGGGGIPRIRENYLTKEGHDFLSHCLQQNAKDRRSANELLGHQFVKVMEESLLYETQ